MQGMTEFMVLYRIESIMAPADPPFLFKCWADNGGHAEEQCINTYPGCDVVWVVEGGNSQGALDDYFGSGDTQ